MEWSPIHEATKQDHANEKYRFHGINSNSVVIKESSPGFVKHSQNHQSHIMDSGKVM